MVSIKYRVCNQPTNSSQNIIFVAKCSALSLFKFHLKFRSLHTPFEMFSNEVIGWVAKWEHIQRYICQIHVCLCLVLICCFLSTDTFIVQFHSNNQFVHSLFIVIIISIIVTTHRDQRTTNEGCYINTLYCGVDNTCHLGYWRMRWSCTSPVCIISFLSKFNYKAWKFQSSWNISCASSYRQIICNSI